MKSIVVVGGGISSLYLSYLLLKTKKYKIYLYEKNNSFGGRIKTEYNKDGNVLYELDLGISFFSYLSNKIIR